MDSTEDAKYNRMFRQFENIYIRYMEAKGNIDPIQPIFDIQTYYEKKDLIFHTLSLEYIGYRLII